MPKFEPVAWLRDTLDGGLSTMTDCCTNVVKEIWLKANPKNVERYTAPLYTLDQLTKAYEAGKHDQAAELEAARAEIERLENQVQARDAELWGRTQKILQLEQQLAAEQAKNVGLRDFIARAQVSSGVCCCGEPMDGHSSPMSCGHSPVDMWDHAVGKLLDAPSDDSALEAYVTKAGEKMRVNCITAAGPEDSYQDDWIRAKADACDAIRALPAVTLADIKPC